MAEFLKTGASNFKVKSLEQIHPSVYGQELAFSSFLIQSVLSE